MKTEEKHKESVVLVIDDTCILCNGFVRFIYKIDKYERVSFRGLSKEERAGQSIILQTSDRNFKYSGAIIQLFFVLGGGWKFVAYFLLCLPISCRDTVYKWIAENRYFFGKRTCPLPSEKMRKRILY